MRVAVDARSAVFPEKTGVGIYTWNLLRWLPRVDPRTTYVAWYLDARGRAGRGLDGGLIERRTRLPTRLFDPLARRFGIPRVEWLTGRFDVLFAPNFVPPPTGAGRVVLTVHDVAFRKFPSLAPERTRRWLAGIDDALSRATRIIVPSRATHHDVVSLFGVPSSRIRVIPHGVDPSFRPPTPEAVEGITAKLGIHRPYLLFVGGMEPRKNLPTLVRAFAKMKPEGTNLVIAGSGVPWNPEGRIELDGALGEIRAEARDRILFTGYVDPADAPALIGGALGLAYPSLYEGFGLPVLEAMACGTPVLASSVSAVPEVVGDAGLLVDPWDADAIAEGLDRLIRDESLRGRLRTAGLRRAESYTWERTARLTAEVLSEA